MLRFATMAAVAVLAAGAAQAQMAPKMVRGTVSAMDASSVTVTSDKGVAQQVALTPTWTVALMKTVTPEAIQPGSFIGTAELPQADGTGRSLEVHVFPPGVKVGEGHYDWDVAPGSMMTNGSVGTVVAGKDGARTIEVAYGTSKRTLTVPANVPIVVIAAGSRDLVKVGAPVFMVARTTPEGGLVTGSISVGENGAKPAM
jgi:hypothetical protein